MRILQKQNKVTAMKTTFCLLLILSLPSSILAQPGIEFYPYHKGDVRQYRSIYTGDLIYTQYTDSVKIDSLTKDTFIFGRNVAGSTNPTEVRIDSLGNLYNMKFQPQYIRYKLYADSGDSWIAAAFNDTATVIVTVTRVYEAYVFGKLKTVKVFQFTAGSFWLGNDYLASGFGLIGTDVEPSDSYYLSGALIDTTHYGIIDDVKERQAVPRDFSLDQNYPNPFNGETIIQYSLSEAEFVQLRVYDMLGRHVATITEGKRLAGAHRVIWDASGLTSGVYFIRLSTHRSTQVRKALLMR